MQEIIKKSQFVPVVTLPNDSDTKEMKYEAWQKLRDCGMTAKQVGDLFGVHPSTVTYHTRTTINLRGGKLNHLACVERKEYYIPLMKQLRERGYSNVDIGKITGFCGKTIREYIGNQPDEVTLASKRAAGAKRKFRNLARVNQPARDDNKPIPPVADMLSA